jgi:hypothetical protein
VDQTELVNIDIQRGADVVAAFDQSKVRVSVALFANLTEYGDWRLVLAARAFDELRITDAYGLLHELLSAAGIGVERTPLVLILPMSDPFVRELRKKFGKTKSVEGMRLGGQLFGGRFVEDGYVYRIR